MAALPRASRFLSGRGPTSCHLSEGEIYDTDLMRNETMPANSLFSNRMQAMTLAVLGQLKATANWHRVMSEWLYGSPPSSPLGIAEGDFFRSSLRSLPRAA